MTNQNHPKVIDCFCGAGGLSLGFTLAGCCILYAFDSDEASVETHKRNIGPSVFIRDAYHVKQSTIESDIGASVGDVDVIAGGPPCQGFSVQRRGLDADLRNGLVLEFMRLVMEIRPRFFLIENVGGLLSVRGKPFMDKIKSDCDTRGYHLHIQKLDAYLFGVPQHRKRAIIVGERVINGLIRYRFPEPPEDRNTYPATVREAISDLAGNGEGDVVNHVADQLSPINLQRIRAIKEGQGRDFLPPHLQLPCHLNNVGHRHLDVYGRMAWDQPSPTITARFDSFSRGRFGHPELDRTITLREGARLQSFPDSFVFVGNKVEIARQIGNAVPPLLAKALAESIRECL